MGEENRDNNNLSRVFSSFDGQWDVISRATAKQYKQAFDDRLTNPKFLSFAEYAKGSRDRFLPSISPVSTSDIKPLELFKCDSGRVCNLNHGATETIAEALLEMRGDSVEAYLQPAGYTYLAQLLTHDIVPNTTLLRTRDASSVLNLDSIYFSYKELKDWGGADSTGKFVFSDDCFDLHRAEWAIDALRDCHYEVPADRTEAYHFAVTPDHRNDGNVILSQLLVFWQKIHNNVVDLLAQKAIEDNLKFDGAHYYEKARQIVVLLFQNVVIHDLLNRTLDQDTFDYYFSYNGPSLFKELDGDKKVVPKEFTHAVSRYAHSMIRPSYLLNEDNDKAVSVEKLFNKNRPLKKAKDNVLISDWTRFFASKWYPSSGKRIKANVIELRASSLPVSSGPLEEESNPAKNLATFDITASCELSTFSTVLKRNEVKKFFTNVKGIRYPRRQYFEKISYDKINEELSSLKGNISLNNSNAPFFVSMHLESIGSSRETNRDRLGVVGSIVYAETIRMSIGNANTNVLQDSTVLETSLDWAYPVYQSIVSSLDSITMMGLVSFNKLIK